MASRVFGAGWSLRDFARAMIPPQTVAISTQSSLASLPAMLAAAKALGVPERNRDVGLPLAVALFRASGPAVNIAVAIYVAYWLQIELTLVEPRRRDRGRVGGELLGGEPARRLVVRHLDRADRAGHGPADRAARLLIAVEVIPDIFRTLSNVTMDVAVTGAVARRDAATKSRGASSAPRSA